MKRYMTAYISSCDLVSSIFDKRHVPQSPPLALLWISNLVNLRCDDEPCSSGHFPSSLVKPVREESAVVRSG